VATLGRAERCPLPTVSVQSHVMYKSADFRWDSDGQLTRESDGASCGATHQPSCLLAEVAIGEDRSDQVDKLAVSLWRWRMCLYLSGAQRVKRGEAHTSTAPTVGFRHN
jgi:hypothetical protein